MNKHSALLVDEDEPKYEDQLIVVELSNGKFLLLHESDLEA